MKPAHQAPAQHGHPNQAPDGQAQDGQALLDAVMAAVVPVDEHARAAAQQRQLDLTKPPGALGRLEDLGNQLAAVSGQCPPPVPEPALVVVVAGDHGVQAQHVSPWPQAVSVQMAATIAQGDAGVSVLARGAGAGVQVVDLGLLTPVPGTVDARIGAGTADMTQQPAMTRDQALAALATGIRLARQGVADGARVLLPGEVGIGNTTPASALVAALTGSDPSLVTGRGAGADDRMLAHKADVVQRALARHGLTTREQALADPVATLAAVGGFEHAAIVGLLLGAAEQRVPLVLDGVIACSAALVAVALCPAARGYLVAAHRGAEPAITVALDELGLDPLLDLGLRLGEGSGAVLALPLLQSAARVLREMATFGGAGVSGADDEVRG